MHRILLLTNEEPDTRTEHASASGPTFERVASLPHLLRAVTEAAWSATVVSLGSELVDAAVLERIAAEANAGALLLTTPHPSLSAALMAERVGAIGVLPEPCARADLEDALGLDHRPADGLDLPDGPLPQSGEMIGSSHVMADVFSMIAKVAQSSSTVLVTGESGTGKELVARALHDASGRANGPFIAVNCAAIPESLLESELFGHEKGAFTGAVAQRRGRFERASGGTLFLDEIGDMSLVLQAKLLRALEERVIERVGGEAEREIDVRVIAATNQDLAAATADGSFREDLRFRLGVVEIRLPPLRERDGDVRRLALHFARHFAQLHERPIRQIGADAMQALEGADWPGNVRELRNVMDRAVLLSTGSTIGRGALRLGSAARRQAPLALDQEPTGYPDSASLAEVESDHIRRVLEAQKGRVSAAASVLGVHRNTLTRKIQEYGLRDGEAGEDA